MHANTEYSGELLTPTVQIKQFSLGGRNLRCWYLVNACPNWNANTAAWGKNTIRRALPMSFVFFSSPLSLKFSPQEGTSCSRPLPRIAMEANNWGCKAAQPTGSKRAAAAQADLSMSFPLSVVWCVKVSALSPSRSSRGKWSPLASAALG